MASVDPWAQLPRGRGDLAPACVVISDVTDPPVLLTELSSHDLVHATVCCLAYEATLHTLRIAHFVLFSAMCMQKPLLEVQCAKLRFKEDLVVEAV